MFSVSLNLISPLKEVEESVEAVVQNIIESAGLIMLPDGTLLNPDGTPYTYEDEFGSMFTRGKMKLREAFSKHGGRL